MPHQTPYHRNPTIRWPLAELAEGVTIAAPQQPADDTPTPPPEPPPEVLPPITASGAAASAGTLRVQQGETLHSAFITNPPQVVGVITQLSGTNRPVTTALLNDQEHGHVAFLFIDATDVSNVDISETSTWRITLSATGYQTTTFNFSLEITEQPTPPTLTSQPENLTGVPIYDSVTLMWDWSHPLAHEEVGIRLTRLTTQPGGDIHHHIWTDHDHLPTANWIEYTPPLANPTLDNHTWQQTTASHVVLPPIGIDHEIPLRSTLEYTLSVISADPGILGVSIPSNRLTQVVGGGTITLTDLVGAYTYPDYGHTHTFTGTVDLPQANVRIQPHTITGFTFNITQPNSLGHFTIEATLNNNADTERASLSNPLTETLNIRAEAAGYTHAQHTITITIPPPTVPVEITNIETGTTPPYSSVDLATGITIPTNPNTLNTPNTVIHFNTNPDVSSFLYGGYNGQVLQVLPATIPEGKDRSIQLNAPPSYLITSDLQQNRNYETSQTLNLTAVSPNSERYTDGVVSIPVTIDRSTELTVLTPMAKIGINQSPSTVGGELFDTVPVDAGDTLTLVVSGFIFGVAEIEIESLWNHPNSPPDDYFLWPPEADETDFVELSIIERSGPTVLFTERPEPRSGRMLLRPPQVPGEETLTFQARVRDDPTLNPTPPFTLTFRAVNFPGPFGVNI